MNFRQWIRGHSLIGLEDESMLLLGGYGLKIGSSSHDYTKAIWQLKDDEWNTVGYLKNYKYLGGHLFYERTIFDFTGTSKSKAIQRIDLDVKENLDNAELEAELLGYLPVTSLKIILLPTVSKYCV